MPDPVVPPATVATATASSSSMPQVVASPASMALFGKYEVGRLLGCGAFAKVYHGRDTTSGQSVALKVLSKPKILRAGLSGHVKREISAMRRLRHPHVVRLHEVLATRSKIYFVLEFAKGGELFSRLQSGGRLHEDVCRCLFRQLISAVAYSHSQGVFHRDLKPENLLLDEAGRLKVSDFGLAAVADHLQLQQQNVPMLFHTLCGTPAYVAPEILSKRAYDAVKADIWSCGVILFVLVTGFLPFNDANLMALYRRIYRGEYRCPRWVSPDLKRLLSRLLDVDPRIRITAAQIIEDPWFRKGLDVARFMAIAGPGFHHHEEIELKIAKIDDEDDEGEREMNAFDIISSFSTGFDLSGLFANSQAALDCPSTRTKEMFVVFGPPEALLERVDEVVAEAPETEVRRRKIAKKGRRAGAAVEGRAGELVLWLEVHRLNRQLSVVEVEVGGREADELFWRDKLRPVLRATAIEPVTPMRGSDRVSSKDEETASSVRSV